MPLRPGHVWPLLAVAATARGPAAAPAPRGAGAGDERAVLHPAQLLPESPTPDRPANARWTAGAEPEVVLRVIVDTAGRVELPSVRVLYAPDTLALAAVRAVLPRLAYLPARYIGANGNCVTYNGGARSCAGAVPRVSRVRSAEVLRVQF